MSYLGTSDALRGNLRHIADGDKGTHETVQVIAKKIYEGMVDPIIIKAATDIVSNCAQKDYECEIESIFHFVRDQIRYVRDIWNVETIRSARRILETFQAGDCDDKCILLASLLLSIGHGPVRLVVIAADHDRQDEYSHIYLELEYNDEWVAMDATVNKPLGWSAPNPYRTATYELTRD